MRLVPAIPVILTLNVNKTSVRRVIRALGAPIPIRSHPLHTNGVAGRLLMLPSRREVAVGPSALYTHSGRIMEIKEKSMDKNITTPVLEVDPEEIVRTCLNCGSQMDDRKCKLVCECGYFASCSDYY